MKKLNTFAVVLSKILEVLHWIGAAVMASLLVITITMSDYLSSTLPSPVPEYGTIASTYGFEVNTTNADGTLNIAAITVFFIGAFIILSLMAMVFRNAYLVLRTAQGKTKFSQGSTPFQEHIVRMVREIGIFFMLIPVVSLILSIIARFVVGVENTEIVVNIQGFITGILILCLSQIFSYGTELQSDVDGLV